MNYLNLIPYDIYTQIYKYVYNDCIKELIFTLNNKRNNKYKDKFIKNIINDENRIYYTSLEMFNFVSLGIINKDENSDKYYDDDTDELEELYFLSDINVNNFTKYHYNILIQELPENFKDATCIKLKLSNIDLLLGFDEDNNEDNVYIPLYYILEDELKTWLELIYYTNKLFNEYLLINNLIINVNFFTLYRFDTIIENGFTVLVPYFDEHFI
jgi:hypothetical protein